MEQKIGLIFQHGWGLSGQCWLPLLKHFKHIPYIILDEGYFKHGKTITHMDAKRWIFIGHSLGFPLFFIRNSMAKTLSIIGHISISSFFCFLKTHSNPFGVDKHELDKMVLHFKNRPIEMLRAFYRKAKYKKVEELLIQETIYHNKLYEDLLLFYEIDVFKDIINLPNILLLQAIDDQIVPFQHLCLWNSRNISSRVYFCERGGHVLFQTATEWCAYFIKQFYQEVIRVEK